MEANLTVKALTALYPTGEGIKEVTFDLFAGQVGVIIGRNGAGKTTLLKALATLMPHSGQIFIGPLSQKKGEAYRKQIAYLSDDPGLPSWLSGQEVAEWVADLWEEKGYHERFKRIAKVFFPNFETLANPIHSFSRGMQQRLGIAATLARKAQLYMLDEPDAYLDALSRIALERQLEVNSADGAMVLFSTHDPQIAAHSSNRLFSLRNGILAELPVVEGPQAIIELLSEDIQ